LIDPVVDLLEQVMASAIDCADGPGLSSPPPGTVVAVSRNRLARLRPSIYRYSCADESQSRTLVGNLLHIEDLPEKVRALILKKAEGNPFFVEEVVCSLLDSKLVVRENSHWRRRARSKTSPPDTLAGVITAG
jgi:hypothetical protein